jgi:hypothetical protein
MKSKLLFLFLGLTQLVSAQNFTEVTGTPFAGVMHSSIAFADVDGDNDQDVLITGIHFDWQVGPPGDRIAKLYTNDGSGNFTEVLGTPFEGVEEGSMAFADVDGDNDQDVLITGRSDAGSISKLYTNDGSGNFTEVMNVPFDGVTLSSIAFTDVDGDNDQDVLITGQNSSFAYTSKLYINDGSGNFTQLTNTPFEGVRNSSIAFADVDGDNDQDVFITGDGATNGAPISKLYTNNGLGAFTEVMGTPFVGVTYGAIAFADVDGDNDQDVLITGNLGSNLLGTSKLYTNDGTGTFTEVIGTPFPGLMASEVTFTDVDGDYDQDVLITGGFGSLVMPFTGLYTNDGSGTFTQIMETPFDELRDGSIAFADVDGDNDQDVLLTGTDLMVNYTAKLYTYDAGVLSLSDDLLEEPSRNLTPSTSLDLTLYPNPTTSDNLHVRFHSTEPNSINVRLYDLSGRLIRQQETFAGTGEQSLVLDIATLPAGTYFIRLHNGRESGIARFMVQ